jgi:pyroglutamyl-peptidase
MKILITGFGRFPGAPFNPSGALAKRLVARRRPAFASVERIVHVFPTSYAAVDRELPALIARHKPDAIVMFGLAGRTPHLRIETQARNRITPVFPDVDRVVPKSTRIAFPSHGPLRGRAPFRTLLQAAKTSGVKARLSRDAGAYLCNYGYWRAIEAAARPAGPRLVVFVHIPKVRTGPRLRRKRSVMPFAKLARAGDAIVLAAINALRRPAVRPTA